LTLPLSPAIGSLVMDRLATLAEFRENVGRIERSAFNTMHRVCMIVMRERRVREFANEGTTRA